MSSLFMFDVYNSSLLQFDSTPLPPDMQNPCPVYLAFMQLWLASVLTISCMTTVLCLLTILLKLLFQIIPKLKLDNVCPVLSYVTF